jgi:hypothetical protein
MDQSKRRTTLSIPSTADRQLLAKTLESLVEQEFVPAEIINAELAKLAHETNQAILHASKLGQNIQEISSEQREQLFSKLEARFNQNANKPKDLEWSKILTRLQNAKAQTIWALNELERDGKEPQFLGYFGEQIVFYMDDHGKQHEDASQQRSVGFLI